MTTPFEPIYAPAVHAATPFGHDHYVIVWRYLRMISNRYPNSIASPQYVKSREKIKLSAFDFQPPYAMNTHIFLAPYNRWFRLIGRFSISAMEEDGCSMDYQAFLVRIDHYGEEKVAIPVPDIFFQENFDLLPPCTPLPSLPTPALNSSPTPSIHRYPPLPSHINEQLGQTGGSVARHQVVHKRWKRRYWAYVFGLSFSIIIIGMLVIMSNLH
ncbi:hypothetical protein M422DRAFT_270245 [Sphaerobolus stellatus SS14]|uniref:Uncharacterized protein n=1 Tax=Sphaerobolus stellatus (strain SS14) TaxID=990650 RepID=A0A0C9UTI9_SPHS4|nr:hypothetical protein M422DRAFT_270245 [Sphaerobolus stellatus SS14]